MIENCEIKAVNWVINFPVLFSVQISWSKYYALWRVVSMEGISQDDNFFLDMHRYHNSRLLLGIAGNNSFRYIVWMVGVEVQILPGEDWLSILLHIGLWQTDQLGITKQDMYLCKQSTAERNHVNWARRKDVWVSRKYIMRKFFDPRASDGQWAKKHSAE